ncbi:MAG: hypothetical protein AB2693_09905 [Candidatus Thiodiazotropha sp.]
MIETCAAVCVDWAIYAQFVLTPISALQRQRPVQHYHRCQGREGAS